LPYVVLSLQPDQRLSGIVDFKVFYKGTIAVERIMGFVDGELRFTTPRSRQASWKLDTRRLADGEHELVVSVWEMGPNVPLIGSTYQRVTTRNGSAVLAVRPAQQAVYLSPGESCPLAAEELRCNGTRTSAGAGPDFASCDDRVATLAKGRIVAKSPGECRIGACRVVVRSEPGIPHLGRGGVLRKYQVGKSVVVRTLFGITALDLARDPALARLLKESGFNTITQGFYTNPWTFRSRDSAFTLEQWKQGYDKWFADLLRPLQEHGFRWLATGDDLCRTREFLADSVGNPWSADAIRHATERLGETGLCVGIEGCDETNFMWKKKPGEDFAKLRSSLRAARGCPPLSWPISVVAPSSAGDLSAQAVACWNDASLADYGSVYHQLLDFRGAYPGNVLSLPQLRAQMERAIGMLPVDRPRSVLIPFAGEFYRKRVAGDHFQEGDQPIMGRHRPEIVQTAIWLALARDCTVLRLYRWDISEWSKRRADTPPGKAVDQAVGTSPTVGADRWRAAVASLQVIEELEPLLLGRPTTAQDWGPEWVTAAREGDAGRVFFAINCGEKPVCAPAALPAYANALKLSVDRGREAVVSSVTGRVVPPGGVVVLWSTR
jgi:hypothetical protein